jgi:hypothetical protein
VIRRRWLALAILVPLVAACSSGTESADPPATTSTTTAAIATTVPAPPTTLAPSRDQACSLVSTDFLTSEFGLVNGTVVPGSSAGWITTQCSWEGTGADIYLSISLAIGSSASLVAADVTVPIEEYFAQRRVEAPMPPGGELRELETDADLAFTTGGPSPFALALKGDLLIQVTTFANGTFQLTDEQLSKIVDEVLRLTPAA